MTWKCTEKPLSIADTPPTGNTRPRVVLDTNVVLAACHFRDPAVAALWAAVTAGDVGWIGTAAMRDELAHVAARLAPQGAPPAWLSDALVHLVLCPVPPVGPPGSVPRCSDPTDQMFVDLALATPADWLLSRDRALLKLAGQARRRGLRIARPDGWSLSDAPPK